MGKSEKIVYLIAVVVCWRFETEEISFDLDGQDRALVIFSAWAKVQRDGRIFCRAAREDSVGKEK